MKIKNERGAGRHKTGMIPLAIRVTPEQAEWLRDKGQSTAIRELIDAEMKKGNEGW